MFIGSVVDPDPYVFVPISVRYDEKEYLSATK
jgi:hypothetical protein